MSNLCDLKSLAGKYCIDIYNEYTFEEVQYLSTPVVNAWLIGEGLVEVGNKL